MVVTLLGMVIDCKKEHDMNAQLPIVATAFPIVTDVNPLQPLNVWSRI